MNQEQKTRYATGCSYGALFRGFGLAILFSGIAIPIFAQEGPNWEKSSSPYQETIQPCANIFAMDVLNDRKGLVGVELFGDNTVPVGGCIWIANYHSYQVIVFICSIDGTREHPYDVLEPFEQVYFPIDDDPRLAGTQFIVKVESISGQQSSLVVTIE